MANDAVLGPNLGLYYGLDPLLVPARGVQDGRNFRIKQGKMSNVNLGWTEDSTIDFLNPIMKVDTFKSRSVGEIELVITTKDIFKRTGANTAVLLNPRYAVGTVDVSAADPAVVTVNTGSPLWSTNEIAPGDMIHFGSATQNSPTAVWYEVDSVDGEGQLTLTTAVSGGALTNSVYTIRRCFTGAIDDVFDTAVFVGPVDNLGATEPDLWFACNGIDWMVSWDGAATTVTSEAAIGIKPKRLAVYKNMLIYANFIQVDSNENFTTSIINSDVGKPLVAGDAGAGISEQFRVHDDVEEIWDLEVLGDNLVIYSARSVVLAQFVGDPLIFIFREAATGIGPLSPRAIVNFGDYHEFIGPDSQYLFDGVSCTEINQHVWREVLRQRDPVRQKLIFSIFDEENGDVIWSIPLTSDEQVGVDGAPAEEALVEHYLEEVGSNPTPFSRREFPFICGGYNKVSNNLTWDSVSETWDQMVVRWNDSFLFAAFPKIVAGSENGTLYKLNSIQTGGGEYLASYVITGRRATGDGIMRGLLTRVYPYASLLNQTLNVRARMMDHAAGPPTIQDQQTFDTTLPEGQHFTSHFRAGRFFEVQFGTSGAPWELSGWKFEAREGGRR